MRSTAQITGCKHCADKLNMAIQNQAFPEDHFMKVLLARKQGGPCRYLLGVGQRDKFKRGQCCLAESVRIGDREFIRLFETLNLHTDARKHRLTINFSAGKPRLEIRRGTLGHVDFVVLKGTEYDASTVYADAIKQIMLNFCTCMRGAPGVNVEELQVDMQLFEHMRSIVEVFDADADPTIQAASEIVTNALCDDDTALFSKGVGHLQDVTHAARR